MPTWSKPSFACLASRFPYGQEITAERLVSVGRAEDALRAFGLSQLRVRYHWPVARIEVEPSAFASVIANAPDIVHAVKACGFQYVALDLQGYRTGSMNETLAD